MRDVPNKYDCRGLTAAVLIALPLVFAVGSLALGAYAISPLDVCRIIAERATGHDFGVSAMAANLVWEVRMPRVLAAAMVGAGLAASGTLFQGLFRNPLAAPDTLGVSNGAGFGAALAIVAGLAGFGAQMGAIAFGLAAVALAFAIVARGRASTVTLILSGMLVGSPSACARASSAHPGAWTSSTSGRLPGNAAGHRRPGVFLRRRAPGDRRIVTDV